MYKDWVRDSFSFWMEIARLSLLAVCLLYDTQKDEKPWDGKMPRSSLVCLINTRCLYLFLFFKKKLVSARQKSKPLASCKGNNFGISSLLSKQVIIKVPIEKWVWMFQNQFIFTFTPTEENAWFAFQPGSGWGGFFTNACKPAWTTYPRKRTKFSGLLSLVKEISTVGCVCDFFLMRKAIAPYKKRVLWSASHQFQVLLGPTNVHFVGVLHCGLSKFKLRTCQNTHANPG